MGLRDLTDLGMKIGEALEHHPMFVVAFEQPGGMFQRGDRLLPPPGVAQRSRQELMAGDEAGADLRHAAEVARAHR